MIKKFDNKAGLSATQLKGIAYACMLVDHFAYAFIYFQSPVCIFLRTIGKMALPIFCFSIVEGYYHSNNVFRYLLRLFLFAFISQPFYSSFVIWVYTRQWAITFLSGGINVLFTLFLALLSITIWNRVKNPFARYVICFIIFILAGFIPMDWGWNALVITWGFFYLHQHKRNPYFIMYPILGFVFLSILFSALPNLGIQYFQFFGLFLSIPLVTRYNGSLGSSPKIKYCFYFIYPAQFILIPLIYYIFAFLLH